MLRHDGYLLAVFQNGVEISRVLVGMPERYQQDVLATSCAYITPMGCDRKSAIKLAFELLPGHGSRDVIVWGVTFIDACSQEDCERGFPPNFKAYIDPEPVKII